MVDHSLWPQLLGISQALYKVQHFHDDSVMDEDPKFGYHFDLKPANILVEQDGRLVITDFGQAVFKAAKDSTDSRVRGMGGTEAYLVPWMHLPRSTGLYNWRENWVTSTGRCSRIERAWHSPHGQQVLQKRPFHRLSCAQVWNFGSN